jgi:pantetheine-phosphate adenylyltransferase
MTNSRVGVYPGTFDPLTAGHMDVIVRALKVVDRLIVGVAVNAGKGPLFSIEERTDMVESEVARLRNGDGSHIEVRSFDNLLTHFVAAVGGTVIVRGLRAVSDFEYEFQMAGMNSRLSPGIETVFLMASERHHFIASRLVKEVARYGGDISDFVTPTVRDRILAKLGAK